MWYRVHLNRVHFNPLDKEGKICRTLSSGPTFNCTTESDLELETDPTEISEWKDKDDERRVFYVGVTRAKENLHIVRSNSNREFSELFQRIH